MDHCTDPTLIYDPLPPYDGLPPPIIKPSKPSTKLCGLVAKEQWRWMRDEPVMRYGINVYQVVPNSSADERTALAWWLSKQKEKLIPPAAQDFCAVAEAEWATSQWGRFHEEILNRWNEFMRKMTPPLPTGTSELVLKFAPTSPPHRYGTNACAAYGKIYSLVLERNQRPIGNIRHG